MDPIILSHKIKKWLEASRYLKSQDQSMAPEEVTALEFLTEAWRTRTFDQELSSEARDMIDVLTRCDQLHGNNRQIISHSKELRGTARMMYTQDAATYEEMRSALRKAIDANKPKPQPTPKPQPAPKPKPKPIGGIPIPLPRPSRPKTPAQPRTQYSSTLGGTPLVTKIETWYHDTEGQYHASDTVPINATYVGFNFFFNPKKDLRKEFGDEIDIHIVMYDPYGNFIKGESDSYTFNLKYPFDRVNSSNYLSAVGYGNKNGSFLDTPGKWTVFFVNAKSGLIFSNHSFTVEELDPIYDSTIRVTGVRFVNTDYDGNIISEATTVDTQYLVPIITYERKQIVGQIKVDCRIYDPHGKLLTSKPGESYTNDCTFTPGQTGETQLVGFGNRNGTCYTIGTYRFEIYQGHIVLYSTTVTITPRNAAPKPNPIPKPNPAPRPNPTPKPAPRSMPSSSGSAGKWVTGIIVALLLGGAIYGYVSYSRHKAAEDAAYYMYTLAYGNITKHDKETPLTFEAPGSQIKVYEIENDGWASVKTSSGEKGYVRADALISEAANTRLNNLINNNPILNNGAGRVAVYDFMQKHSEIIGSQWEIYPIPSNLSPHAAIMEQNLNPKALTLAFIVTSPQKSICAVYTFDNNNYAMKQALEQERAGAQLIAGLKYSSSRDSYTVTYAPATRVVSPKGDTPNNDYPLVITGLTMVSTDARGNFINNGVSKRTQYASPRITYKVLGSAMWHSKSITIKMFDSQGNLIRGASSPNGATFIDTLQFTEKSGSRTLTGWGSPEGGFWDGTGYRVELWSNNTLLAMCTF